YLHPFPTRRSSDLCPFAGEGDGKEACRMIRKIFLIAGENFSGWHRNVRIWLTFALGLVLCLMLSEQMLSRAQTYESPVQMFEPFIWTFGNGQSVLLSTLLLLILFADMPFFDQ